MSLFSLDLLLLDNGVCIGVSVLQLPVYLPIDNSMIYLRVFFVPTHALKEGVGETLHDTGLEDNLKFRSLAVFDEVVHLPLKEEERSIGDPANIIDCL